LREVGISPAEDEGGKENFILSESQGGIVALKGERKKQKGLLLHIEEKKKRERRKASSINHRRLLGEKSRPMKRWKGTSYPAPKYLERRNQGVCFSQKRGEKDASSPGLL